LADIQEIKMTMTKKTMIILIIALIALVSCVAAETLTGTIGEFSLVAVDYPSWGSPTGSGTLVGITIREPSAITNTVYTIINWGACTVDAGAPSGNQMPVNFHQTNKTGTVLGHGVVGYQILFNNANPPVQTACYQYVLINSPMQLSQVPEEDPANHYTTLYFGDEYTSTDFNNLTLSATNAIASMPLGSAVVETTAGRAYGAFSNNLDKSVYVEYTATKPGGLGISGSIDKWVGGVYYTVRGYIFDVNGNPLASEGTATSNAWNFTTNATQIKIGIYANAQYYNSSLLFSAGAGTPVPTSTPTPAPTIAPGYIRTEIAAIDIYGARIYGTTINILDVEAGVWKNSTNDADGLVYVDTLPYHTLNVYGSYTLIADQYLDAQLIGISTGYDGGIRFYLVMYPADIDPGLGNVNLYVTVLDNNGLVPIPTALVKVGIPGNPTLSGYTSSSGVQRFVVPNQTVLHITAEKSGYQTGGTIINSGTGVTADAIIALDRITVTPTTTGYIPTGGITPVVTFDSRTPNEKDTGMMEIIRNAGPDLINLAIAATIVGLLGLMMKGLK
jgi:hypothetical protein